MLPDAKPLCFRSLNQPTSTQSYSADVMFVQYSCVLPMLCVSPANPQMKQLKKLMNSITLGFCVQCSPPAFIDPQKGVPQREVPTLLSSLLDPGLASSTP